MTNAIRVLVTLWATFLLVPVPFYGFSPRQPEFWLTPLLYGAPLLLLAWPLYLSAFRRVPTQYRWALPVVGFCFAVAPCLLMQFVDSAVNDRPFVSPLAYFGGYYLAMAFWYALFGAFLGGWIAWSRRGESESPM